MLPSARFASGFFVEPVFIETILPFARIRLETNGRDRKKFENLISGDRNFVS